MKIQVKIDENSEAYKVGRMSGLDYALEFVRQTLTIQG